MSAFKPAVVTKQFHDDFELVATHYGLRVSGEYEAAKNVARNDLDEAITTFSALADEIKNG